LVEDYELAEETPLARETLTQIIERKPKRAITAYRKLRSLLVREKEWEAAQEIQRKIEELLGEGIRKEDRRYSLGIPYQLACRYAAEERNKDALAILRRQVKEHPDFVPAAWKLGKVLVAAGESDEAIGIWRRGFETTSAPVFLTTLEDHFLQLEEPQRAIEVFKQLVWKAKRDVIARFFLGSSTTAWRCWTRRWMFFGRCAPRSATPPPYPSTSRASWSAAAIPCRRPVSTACCSARWIP
jgi:lipopolysaccharide biosynthesis regulator YciM